MDLVRADVDQAETSTGTHFRQWQQLAWLVIFHHPASDTTTHRAALARTDLVEEAVARLRNTCEVEVATALPHAVTALHGVDTGPEVVMARREVAMAPEEDSVAVLRLPAGMEEVEAATVLPVVWVLDLVGRLHHQAMAQIPTTGLKAVWHYRDRLPHKSNLLREGLRQAVTLLSARLSRWTSVLAAHPVSFLSRSRPTV